MSLEGYKPLDLSSLQLTPLDLSGLNLQHPISTGDIAKQILAGTKWDITPVESLGSNGKPIPHKKSFVSRLMDLLSIGNYAVSDAALAGLKEHQSDNNDNPLVDIIKSASIIPTGFDKGILASLKGAFGDTDTANDPSGKNHFGDVLLQASSRGRKALDPNSGMSLDERKHILKQAYLSGLPSDIILDPLNLIGIGEVKAAKNLASGGKIAGEAAQKAEDIDKLANVSKVVDVANEAPKKLQTDLKTDITNTPIHTAPNTFDPETFDFITGTSNLPDAIDNINTLRLKSPVGVNVPKIELPKSSGRLAKPSGRRTIAGVMLQNIVRGDDWGSVSNKLQQSFPGLHLPKTLGYLDHLSKNPKTLQGLKNIPANRTKFVEAIDRLLEHDYENAGRQLTSLRLPELNMSDVSKLNSSKVLESLIGPKPPVETEAVKAAPTVKRDEQLLTNHMINKYGHQIRTGEFPGIRNIEHYRQAVASGKTVKWSGPKQVNMFQTILTRIPFAGTGKYNKALRVLRNVEEHFMGLGNTPYSASKASESIELRLSDVLQHLNPAEFMKNPQLATTLLRSALAGGEMPESAMRAPELANEIQSAVNSVKSGQAIEETQAVREGIDAGSTEATAAVNSGNSDARIEQDINMAAKTAKDIARVSGASPSSINVAGDVIKQTFLKRDPIENAIGRSLINTKAVLTTGNIGKHSNVPEVTNAIHTVIGGPSPTVLSRAIGSSNMAVPWLGARFNTAYKNADMRPIYLEQAATARSSVARRAEVWNRTVRQFGTDHEVWDRALKAAQGLYIPPVGSPEHQLSILIRQNLENLFGSSGLITSAELDNTVVGRSQLTMKELNANLRRYGLSDYKFSKGKKVADFNNVVHDYSNGIDWLNSWESWDVRHPLNFMMRITNAVENTVREANMFNEIAARWGSKLKAGSSTAINHPRLVGYYFPRKTAEQIRVMIHNLDEIKKPNSKFLRLVDNVLSKWKSSVTVYMPSHHIRNMIGDSYMNWLAGVNDPKAYSTALKVMKSQKGRYDSIEDIGKLTNPNAVLESINRAMNGLPGGEKGSNVAFTMRNGLHVTNDMVYTAAFQKGLLPGARILEDITDDGLAINKFRPLGGRGQAAFQHLAEYREHAIRLAHFVDVMKKSPKNFAGAVEDATRAVRKWHPDGMDLTKFERDVMRRIFPFYSWTRKALPLMIESLVMAPGKVVLYPKVMGELSQALTGGQGVSDPFPTDQLFPQWIRDKGVGPLFGSSGNYTVVNPSNPTLDLASQFGSPLYGIGSMLNPFLKIPAEELTKTDMNTGAPITNQADYLTKQIPGISTVGRVTNIGLGGPTNKWDSQGGPNPTALVNLLTALGIINTGQYQKEAQFELRDYLRGK